MDISVGTAALGAAISVIALVISKENKTSEFRQAWVDGLRDDLSQAISAVSSYLATTQMAGISQSEQIAWWSKISATLAKIELRLNKTEDDHKGLIALIREAESLVNDAQNGNYDQERAENLEDRVKSASTDILKREWERVKLGEPDYRAARSGAIFVLLILTIAFVAQFLGSLGSGCCVSLMPK